MKAETIELRVTLEQKQTIRIAAERSGLSMSSFVLSAALRVAHEEASKP